MTWFGRRSADSVRRGSDYVQSKNALELLESRIMFHLEVTTPVADVTVTPGSSPTQINLNSSFDNENFTGTLVRFTTPLGNLDFEMFDAQKPLSVTNFLGYVNRGDYNSTFVHRSANITGNANGPKHVIQGGGFKFPGFGQITNANTPTVPNEFSTNGVISNVRGTVAYAKSNDPNSATSQWFINLTNDPTAVNFLDNPSSSGGFTVFAHLINNTLTTADAIAALPTFAFASPFGEIPLRNYTQSNFPTTPAANNVVSVDNATVIPEISYQVISNSNPTLVTPTVTNGSLSLAYATGQAGSSTITVRATDVTGATVDDTFDVNVAGGSNLDVTIGTGGAKAATFTDADGTTATISLKGGTAILSFLGSGLSQTASNKGVTVNGTGIDLDSVSITGAAGAGSLAFKTVGGNGRLNVATLTSDGSLKQISGKGVALTGSMIIAGVVSKLDLLRAENASITFSSNAGALTITIGAMVDSSITSAAPIKSLKIEGFNNSPSTSAETISAPGISKLAVAGDYQGNLTLGGPLSSGTVGGGVGGGTWSISGGAGKLKVGSTSSDWVGNVSGDVAGLTVGGNFAGDLNANSIRSMKVGGNLQNGGLTLSAPAGAVALGALSVGGAVNSANIRATAGNLGKITVGSLIGSTIYAVANLPDGGVLPSTLADIGAAAIAALSIKNKAAVSFSNSNIAAGRIGKLDLGVIQVDNGGVPFGFAADSVASLSVLETGGSSLKLSKLDDPAAAAQTVSQLGNLLDFVIRIV